MEETTSRADGLWTIRNGGNLTHSQREMGMLRLKDIRQPFRKNKDNRTTFSRGWQGISGLWIGGKNEEEMRTRRQTKTEALEGAL